MDPKEECFAKIRQEIAALKDTVAKERSLRRTYAETLREVELSKQVMREELRDKDSQILQQITRVSELEVEVEGLRRALADTDGGRRRGQ